MINVRYSSYSEGQSANSAQTIYSCTDPILPIQALGTKVPNIEPRGTVILHSCIEIG